MNSFGVAHLTALELVPPQLVRRAAEAGFRSVGFRVHPAMAGGIAYPSRIGTRTHRELRNVLDGEGVALNEIEFIPLTPDVRAASFAEILEGGADLGASSVTVSGDDPDKGRLISNFAALCDLAAQYGQRVDIEFMRWRVVGTLEQAAAIVSAVDRPNAAVLLDALHLSRSGGDPADVRDLSPGFVRAAQICDAAANPPTTDEEAVSEAREGRLAPGSGALPLIEFLGSLPRKLRFPSRCRHLEWKPPHDWRSPIRPPAESFRSRRPHDLIRREGRCQVNFSRPSNVALS